jgi:hypothetical protein
MYSTIVAINSRHCCQHFSLYHFLVEVLISVEFSLSGSRFLCLHLSLRYHRTSFSWKQKSGDALQMFAVTCFRHSGRLQAGFYLRVLCSHKTPACRIPASGSFVWINVCFSVTLQWYIKESEIFGIISHIQFDWFLIAHWLSHVNKLWKRLGERRRHEVS